MTLTIGAPVLTPARPRTDLPVVVLGAGPIGLAAAAELLDRGLDPLVLEAGDAAGAAVAAWGHVRLFSPWQHVVSPAAVRLLTAAGWALPTPDAAPSGTELVEHYLAPLAALPALASRIRYGVRATAVSREGMDRSRSARRAETPFVVRVQTEGGNEHIAARAVIDATGTTGNPNSIRSDGMPLTSDLGGHLTGGLPDVLGADRDRLAGRHVVVVGAGHSAANTLIALARLAEQEPGTRITWAVRNASAARLDADAEDGLAARGNLASGVHRLVSAERIEQVAGFEIDDARLVDDAVHLTGRRNGRPFTLTADVVVNSTGFRPDLDGLREIRLDLDAVVEAPRRLAPLIDPNVHSCGTVPPHGAGELRHGEPDFYIAGMKSYGRAPTFLLLTGYEQVRSIAADLAGDTAASRRVQLLLPATGVCSTSDSTSCCS